MTIETISYPYEPTPDDLAKFEAIWLQVWEPQCKFLDTGHYNFFRNFAFDNYLIGVNQYRTDIAILLERSLNHDN